MPVEHLAIIIAFSGGMLTGFGLRNNDRWWLLVGIITAVICGAIAAIA